jgi:UDP-N-acetylglucosamine 2-epimerase (non-hydrolysing)
VNERPTAVVVMGTRPEAIKLAPVVAALHGQGRLRPLVVATSQHRELLRQALAPFEIVPDHDLDVMTEGQTPAHVAAAVMTRLEPLLAVARPLWTVVQGDTTSAFAAAVTSFYAGVPVAHVEAGLRTGRLDAPFPEEFNRRGVAVATALHCAPTPRAAANLRREGVPEGAIAVTGNTVVDAVQHILRVSPPSPRRHDGSVQVLVTLHRRESFGAPLEGILTALRRLAQERRPRLRLLYPVHPNPNVAGPARRILGGVPGVELVEPLDYPALLGAFAASRFAISDSGGIQEEAPSVGVPVLVTREVTERPEVVEAGWAELVGTDPQRLLAAARRLLDDDAALAAMTSGPNPFGDGRAGARIANLLAARVGWVSGPS